MDLLSDTLPQTRHPQQRTQHDKQQRQPIQDADTDDPPYDLLQIQACEAYYPYAQPYNRHHQYYPQQHAYNYGNAMAGVSIYQEEAVQVGKQLLQNSYDFPSGLEPAAAAAVTALSQVSQFAGKMNAVEQALAGMPEQLWSNGAYVQMPGQHPFLPGAISFQPNVCVSKLPHRDRRGEPFGGDSRSFDQHHPCSDNHGLDGRGRDQMSRSGRRHFQRNASDVILLSYEPAPYQEPQSHAATATESTAAQATDSVVAPATLQGQRTPQTAWCDLCKVDCNTLEILEQHKNGKRHKKKMKKFEELREHKDILLKSQQQASGHPLLVIRGEESKQTSVEDLSKATVTTDENQTTEQATLRLEQVVVLTTGLTDAATSESYVDCSFGYQEGSLKRKLQKKFGRQGKRMKQSESVSNRSGARKEQPKYCALCHVTCDTQAVFESHLAGRKHTTRVAKGSQGKYRAVGLHALYMPNAQQTGSESQLQQGSQITVEKSVVKESGQQVIGAL